MGISIDAGNNWGGYTPSGFKADVSSLANSVKESFSDGIQNVTSKIESAVTTVVDFKEEVETKFENGFQTISNAFTSATSNLKDQVNVLVTGTKTLTGELKTALSQFGEKAQAAGEKLSELAKEGYEWVTNEENWKKVGAKVESGIELVGSKVESAVEWVTNEENWKKIGATIKNGVQTAAEWASKPENWKKLAVSIKEGVKDAAEWASKAENWKKVGATIAVTATSVWAGVADLSEKIWDGIAWCGAKTVEGVTFVAAKVMDAYGHGDAAESLMNWRENMKTDVAEFIAKDHVKEVEKKFFEETNIGQKINEASYLKYDSKVAQGISSVTEKVAEFAAATAITVATGGAGVGSFAAVFGAGFLAGAGGSAEKNYSQIKENGGAPSLDDKSSNILFDAIGSGLSWYAQGQMGKGAIEAAEAASKVGAGTVKNQMVNTFKESFSEFKNLSGKEKVAKIFSKNNLKNSLFSGDNLADSGGVVADNIAAWVNGDKEFDLKSILGAGAELFGTMAINVLTGGIIDNASKADDVVDTARQFDDVELDDIKREYQDLLEQQKQSWYQHSKEATANGWAQNLNDAIRTDQIDDRVREIEKMLSQNGIDPKAAVKNIEKPDTMNIGERLGFFKKEQRNVSYNMSNRAAFEHIDIDAQRRFTSYINDQISQSGRAVIDVRHTTELTSDMLRNVDDLSKVDIRIYGGFADLDGNFKAKYMQPKYWDRMTYSGPEALSIVERLEQLEMKVDKSLPVNERARQIYEIISDEIPVMPDYRQFPDGHKVSASLRGLTSNNAVGKEGLVCAGYATAYKELCERCGIKCDYISGQAVIDPLKGNSAGKHAWNVVIDGDDIIPVDATWRASGFQGGDWWGPSERFQLSHVAESDEVYKVYNVVRNTPVVSPNQINNIDNGISEVLSTMDAKYGSGMGMVGLRKYVATGDLTKITRTNGARDIIANMSIDEISEYIRAVDFANQSNFTSLWQTMANKYGNAEAVGRINHLIKTGDYNIITRDANARSIAQAIPLDVLQNFMGQITL